MILQDQANSQTDYIVDIGGQNFSRSVDCQGRQYRFNPVPSPLRNMVMRTALWVDNNKNLRCQTVIIDNGTVTELSSPATIAQGVEKMVVRYLIPETNITDKDNFNGALWQWVNASYFDPSAPLNLARLSQVVAVDVCLDTTKEISKTFGLGAVQGSYENCDGATVTPSTNQVHRVFRSMVALRNILSVSGGT
jgi:hypothetical protein